MFLKDCLAFIQAPNMSCAMKKHQHKIVADFKKCGEFLVTLFMDSTGTEAQSKQQESTTTLCRSRGVYSCVISKEAAGK